MPEMKKIKSYDHQISLKNLIKNREKENQYKLMPMKNIGKTEFKREFTKKNVVIENPIKNKELTHLKYNFKKTINA